MVNGILSRSTTAATFKLQGDGQTKIISEVGSSHEFALIDATPDILALFDPKLGITIDQAWDITNPQRMMQRAISPLEKLISTSLDELSKGSDESGVLRAATKNYLPMLSGKSSHDRVLSLSSSGTVLSRTLIYTSLDINELPLFAPKMKLVKLYTNVLNNMEEKLNGLINEASLQEDGIASDVEERARDLIRDYGESSIPIIGDLIFTGTIAPDIVSLLLRAAANANISDGIEELFRLLEKALTSSNAGLRYAAVEGLSSLKGNRSRNLIRSRLAYEQNRSVKAAMRVAL